MKYPYKISKTDKSANMVAHIYSFNTWEANAGGPQQVQECLKVNNNNNLNSYLKKIFKSKVNQRTQM